jgi:hypothetical protein
VSESWRRRIDGVSRRPCASGDFQWNLGLRCTMRITCTSSSSAMGLIFVLFNPLGHKERIIAVSCLDQENVSKSMNAINSFQA